MDSSWDLICEEAVGGGWRMSAWRSGHSSVQSFRHCLLRRRETGKWLTVLVEDLAGKVGDGMAEMVEEGQLVGVWVIEQGLQERSEDLVLGRNRDLGPGRGVGRLEGQRAQQDQRLDPDLWREGRQRDVPKSCWRGQTWTGWWWSLAMWVSWASSQLGCSASSSRLSLWSACMRSSWVVVGAMSWSSSATSAWSSIFREVCCSRHKIPSTSAPDTSIQKSAVSHKHFRACHLLRVAALSRRTPLSALA